MTRIEHFFLHCEVHFLTRRKRQLIATKPSDRLGASILGSDDVTAILETRAVFNVEGVDVPDRARVTEVILGGLDCLVFYNAALETTMLDFLRDGLYH